MKELVVLSGKGGTGKTSLTASFAALAGNCVLCDTDVDAADLHLLLSPSIRQQNDFKGGNSAKINPDPCSRCGLCRDLCRFGAICPEFTIDEIKCEGCGVCVYFCPEKAIAFNQKTCGQWFVSDTRFGTMIHARLGIAEENSGKLVTLVRKEARKAAVETKSDLILTDGPPGIGCPVIASLGGADLVVIITEPTMSGRHDLKRVAELAAHFKVPAVVCINKSDLNIEQTREIRHFAADRGLPVAGEIPFDPRFVESMILKQAIVESDEFSKTAEAVRKIWKNITIYLKTGDVSI